MDPDPRFNYFGASEVLRYSEPEDCCREKNDMGPLTIPGLRFGLLDDCLYLIHFQLKIIRLLDLIWFHRRPWLVIRPPHICHYL